MQQKLQEVWWIKCSCLRKVSLIFSAILEVGTSRIRAILSGTIASTSKWCIHCKDKKAVFFNSSLNFQTVYLLMHLQRNIKNLFRQLFCILKPFLRLMFWMWLHLLTTLFPKEMMCKLLEAEYDEISTKTIYRMLKLGNVFFSFKLYTHQINWFC